MGRAAAKVASPVASHSCTAGSKLSKREDKTGSLDLPV